MSKLSDTIERRLSRFAEVNRQVLRGTFKQPLGLTRGLVRIGGCDQIVTAARPSEFDKDEAVIVVRAGTGAASSYALLPGPPARPGRRSAGSLQLAGVPFEAPPNVDVAQFLILFRNFAGEIFYEAYRADGTNIGFVGIEHDVDGVGTSFFPEISDNLGPGVRVMRDSTTDDLVVADMLGAFVGDPPEFLGGSLTTYTPPSPWIVTHAQKIGNSIYWFEWQTATSSATTSVRLMVSTTADLSSPSVVESGTVTATTFVFPDWFAARGPDFTDDEAGVWLGQILGGSFNWSRIRIPLAGGSVDQRGVDDDADLVPSVLRAGHAATGTSSITQTSGEAAPPETTAFPSVIWNGDEQDDVTAWASVGDVIDFSPDPTPGFWWVLKESPVRIERYNDAGGLQQTITIDDAFNPIGLHFLAETFDIPIPPPE